jgi:hypothetical protein
MERSCLRSIAETKCPIKLFTTSANVSRGGEAILRKRPTKIFLPHLATSRLKN